MKAFPIFLPLILMFAAVPSTSGEDNFTVKAGGMTIIIPAPSAEYQEVGYDKREFMEVTVPVENRLLAAFFLADELKKWDVTGELKATKYMYLQVQRKFEHLDCLSEDFDFIEDTYKDFPEITPEMIEEFRSSFFKNLETMNLEDTQFGVPDILGKVFSIPDAFAFSMILKLKDDQGARRMLCNICNIRVNNRLLIAYVYSESVDEASLMWINDISETWVKEILAANRK